MSTPRSIPTLSVRKIDENAVPLKKAYDNPAGIDLSIIRLIKVEKGIAYFGTGWSVQPSSGYYTEIVPRSSLPSHGWTLANSVGIIDEDYTGELIVALQPTLYNLRMTTSNPDDTLMNVTIQNLAKKLPLPKSFVQLIVRRKEEFTLHEVEQLSSTKRGEKGFGSSDSS